MHHPVSGLEQSVRAVIVSVLTETLESLVFVSPHRLPSLAPSSLPVLGVLTSKSPFLGAGVDLGARGVGEVPKLSPAANVPSS